MRTFQEHGALEIILEEPDLEDYLRLGLCAGIVAVGGSKKETTIEQVADLRVAEAYLNGSLVIKTPEMPSPTTNNILGDNIAQSELWLRIARQRVVADDPAEVFQILGEGMPIIVLGER